VVAYCDGGTGGPADGEGVFFDDLESAAILGGLLGAAGYVG